MDTQGMTPEEKAVVMQFMGQTYGQLHQQDQNIIGTAGNLKPKSQEMKQVFEQTAHMPVHQRRQPGPPPQQPPAQPAPPVQQVTPEQAAAQLHQAPPQPPPNQPAPVQLYDDSETKSTPNQMELDLSEPKATDKLFNLLEEQNLLLKEISLKLDNGKKTTKGRKQS